MTPGTQNPTSVFSKVEWTAAVTNILVARFQKPSDITSVPRWGKRIPTSLAGDYTKKWIDGVVQECVKEEHAIHRQCKKENRTFYPTEPHIAVARVLGLPILGAERFPPDVGFEGNSDDDTSSDSDSDGLPTSLDQLDDLIQRFGGGRGHTGWAMLKNCVSMLRKRENELSRHTLELQRASYTRDQDLEERHRLLKQKEAELDDEQKKLAYQITAIERRESALSLAEGQLHEKEEDYKTTIEANMLTEKLLLSTREDGLRRREAALKQREEALGGATDRREPDLSSREAEIHAIESKLQNDISAFEDAVSGRSAEFERQTTELQARIESASAHEAKLQQREVALEQKEAELKALQAELDSRKPDAATARAIESARMRTLLRLAYEADVKKLKQDEQALHVRQQEVNAKEAELKQLADQLDARSLKLDERQSRLEEEQEALRKDRDALEQANKALQDRSVVLHGREMRQEEKEKEHMQKIVDLERAKGTLRDRESAIERRGSELSNTAASLSSREEGVLEREQAALAKEEAQATRESELEERSQALDERQRNLATAVSDYNAKAADMEVLKFDNSVKGKELLEKAAQLEIIQAGLDDKEKLLGKREQGLATFKAGLDERASRLAEEERRIAISRSNLSNDVEALRRRDSAELQEEYQKAKARVSEKAKQLQAFQAQLLSQQRQLDDQVRQRQSAYELAAAQLQQREARVSEREKHVQAQASDPHQRQQFEVRVPPRPWSRNNPFAAPSSQSAIPYTSSSDADSIVSITSPDAATGNNLAVSRVPDFRVPASPNPWVNTPQNVPAVVPAGNNSVTSDPESNQSTFSHGSRVNIYGGNFFNIGGNLSETNIGSHSDPISRPARSRAWWEWRHPGG